MATQSQQSQIDKVLDVDVIDIKQLIATLLDKKKTILITTAVFFIIAALYCSFRVPTYDANILLNSDLNSSGASLSSVIGGELPSILGGDQAAAKAQTEISLIQSRSVLEPVVKSLHLDVIAEPDYFPIIGKGLAHRYDAENYANEYASPLAWLSSFAWGGESIEIGQFEVSTPLKAKEFTLVNLGQGRYQLYGPQGDKLGVGAVGKPFAKEINSFTRVYLLVNSLKSPVGVKFRLKELHMMDALQAISSKLSVSLTDKNTPLINLGYTGYSPEKTAEILDAIADQAVRQDVYRKSEQAAKTLAFLKQRIPSVQQSVYQAEKALNDYRSQSGNISLDAETKLMMQSVTDLESKIYDLKVQKAQLLQQFTERSVQVEEVNTSIVALTTQLKSLNIRLKNLPQADQVAVNLIRNAKVQNTIYTNLMQKVQQFELLKAGTVGDLSVIDYANIPYKISNKPTLLIIILVTFIGFFLSMIYVFIRKALFQGIEDPDVIESRHGLSVLGTLLTSPAQQQQVKDFQKNKVMQLKLLSELDPMDMTVEALRSLRTNLTFELAAAKNNIINISGPCPNVGKTFVSVNLAHVLSETGQRVLVIDGDLRRGSMHDYFGLSREHGLIDVLEGKLTLEHAVHRTHIDNLDMMPTGALIVKHAELLMGNKLGEVLEQLSSNYDAVIIDTAPILAITDASLVAQYAGTNIVVFADTMHDDKEIELTINRFEKAGVKLAGFIFNNMQMATTTLSNKYKYAYRYEARKN
ncbi:Tyrosine-protein kinase wzc [Piscirickettsia salmonis]|nr:Tyrosine-protein kinase wzc [Piscirickettsia salmonis]QGP57588.1 Tyrosine-protein kinase wzc [Piscirickettsia salmonis]QGP62293.1 Tyrosine-protein kinase wzc [Piscirickettsia salmonis]